MSTSKLPEAMYFACSDKVPCSHIFPNNINLGRMDGTAETCCNVATGFGIGYVYIYVQPSRRCQQRLHIKHCEENQLGRELLTDNEF